jgi:glycosyltransferase involved in cell wall biosynthesis
LRIVLTSHVFLPEHSAGTEILTFESARELQRRGCTVEVVSGFMARPGLADHQRFDRYEHEGIPVNRFSYSPTPMGPQSSVGELEYNNLLFGKWFKDYLARFSPDVVHFFHLGHISASAIDVCHELNLPRVMTPTDFWLVCPNCQLRLPDNSPCRGPDDDSLNCVRHAAFNVLPSPLNHAFEAIPRSWLALAADSICTGLLSRTRRFPSVRALRNRSKFLRQRMNMLDRVIAPTQLMGRILVENGLDAKKLVFSRFGLRPAKFVPHVDHAEGKMRVGFIGGLAQHKGAHVLLNAIRSLPNLTAIEVKVYGDLNFEPQYSRRLEKLAKNDGRISFCGTFSNASIAVVFSELDVLVVPSVWYENTPLVIYSAQEAGCPVIASNLGGMSEVIKHEINGLLFEAGDFAGLAGAIERLAQDRALLLRLSQNAEKPKSISDYVSELLTIYGEVLSERGIQS